MTRWIFQHWQRKILALITAIIVWLFVNHSITTTKTIPNVPVKIVKLQPNKTISGLLSNGYLENRVTLAISGTKDVVDDLEPGDMEVMIDASAIDMDEWVVVISKKNLVSLNPSIDLSHHVTNITHPEFVIRLSDLVTENVPIIIRPPIGRPPEGYDFLDIWPQHLTQTLTGPKEEIEFLKTKGLKLIFDLDQITKKNLDTIKNSQSSSHNDEISYLVPNGWKKVKIPYNQYASADINDPESKYLRIDFLNKGLIPINKRLPIEVYYPLKSSETINPYTYTLALSSEIEEINGLNVITTPMYVRDVSRLFLDIIRDNIKIVIIAAPKTEREALQWSIDVVDPHELEDTYVAYLIASASKNMASLTKQDETVLRHRFREYLRKLTLYINNEQKLYLRPVLAYNKIVVKTNIN